MTFLPDSVNRPFSGDSAVLFELANEFAGTERRGRLQSSPSTLQSRTARYNEKTPDKRGFLMGAVGFEPTKA